MMTDHAEALAKAVHAVLRDDFHVQDSFGEPPRLYDAAPEDPVFPYLTYGAMRSEDIGADETPLSAHQMTLHIWSRYAGRAEVLTLIRRVNAALTAETLTAAGDIAVRSANPIYSDILRAPDGFTRHGVLRLSFTVQGDAI
ncbi:DUF3168 domain-containing protein [Litorimonas sp. WD9-15]|uniref:DUF3168 domain-containing protein n=1 Tax=Litorimonas sp. WD9-15 TaxID=3418716 RepID=UPI003D02768F